MIPHAFLFFIVNYRNVLTFFLSFFKVQQEMFSSSANLTNILYFNALRVCLYQYTSCLYVLTLFLQFWFPYFKEPVCIFINKINIKTSKKKALDVYESFKIDDSSKDIDIHHPESRAIVLILDMFWFVGVKSQLCSVRELHS